MGNGELGGERTACGMILYPVISIPAATTQMLEDTLDCTECFIGLSLAIIASFGYGKEGRDRYGLSVYIRLLLRRGFGRVIGLENSREEQR